MPTERDGSQNAAESRKKLAKSRLIASRCRCRGRRNGSFCPRADAIISNQASSSSERDCGERCQLLVQVSADLVAKTISAAGSHQRSGRLSFRAAAAASRNLRKRAAKIRSGLPQAHCNQIKQQFGSEWHEFRFSRTESLLFSAAKGVKNGRIDSI